jgi:hypothetical protein
VRRRIGSGARRHLAHEPPPQPMSPVHRRQDLLSRDQVVAAPAVGGASSTSRCPTSARETTLRGAQLPP